MRELKPLGTERVLSVRSPVYNSTTAFVLPFIAPPVFASKDLIEAYAADCEDREVCDIPGDRIYILVNGQIALEELVQTFTKHPGYRQFYRTSDGIVVEYELTKAEEKQCLKAVLEGKYSKIPGTLLKMLNLSDAYSNVLKMIVQKDPIIRTFIEKQVGEKLNPDAEVWSRPHIEREVYRADNTTLIRLPQWETTYSTRSNDSFNVECTP